MTVNEFMNTLGQAAPPVDLKPILKALWYDANGDWENAHGIAQAKEGTAAYDRLHAYLHRKEGDDSNARYWYRRANAAVFQGPVRAEWETLVAEYSDNQT